MRLAYDTRKVVVCCGDNLTHGHIGHNWMSDLREKDTNHNYVNAGNNLDLAWNLSQRIDEIIKCKPSIITIQQDQMIVWDIKIEEQQKVLNIERNYLDYLIQNGIKKIWRILSQI